MEIEIFESNQMASKTHPQTKQAYLKYFTFFNFSVCSRVIPPSLSSQIAGWKKQLGKEMVWGKGKALSTS